MVDDRTSTRINLLQESDVHFWCRAFDVSPAELRAAVQQVGPQVDAVRRHLGRQAAPAAKDPPREAA